MPKIIFTSRYMRDVPPVQLKNYVRYIATREGVEKVDESKLQLPATKNQCQMIKELLRDIPDPRRCWSTRIFYYCECDLSLCVLKWNLTSVKMQLPEANMP